ncbi:hypothetical protein ACFSGX_11990 [Sphingomonas arantia]|uniref:Uncharacterized protein n=1 Tax=Sphingomonas arantia TaxID=1460676 RepID=A0ABW4TXN9_9SPHN
MATDPTFLLYDSNLGDILRGMQPEGLHASLHQIPIRFGVAMPEPIRARFLANAVLNNDVQVKLAGAIRLALQEGLFRSITDNSRADPALRARVDHVMRRSIPILTKVVVDAIRASMRISSAWRDYRDDSGKELARISVSLAAAGIAAGIAPPTAGVSIGLLIVALGRGVADLSKKFSESYRTADESRLRVIAEIERLAQAYDRGKAVGRLSQIAGAAAHALTVGKIATVVGSDPFPGFTRIKSELNAYKGKLGHLNSHAERLGSQLYQLLQAIEAYRADHGITGTNQSDQSEIGKLERSVVTLLGGEIDGKWKETSGRRHGFRGTTTISGAWKRSRDGLNQLRDVEIRLAALRTQEDRSDSVLIADRSITLLLNLGVALAGYNGAFSVAGGSQSQVQTALRVNPAGPAWQGGAGALALAFFRQFLSVFKDTHALAKELNIITKRPDGSEALLDHVSVQFAGVTATPRLSVQGLDLIKTLEAGLKRPTLSSPALMPSPLRPPRPTRALPPPPKPTRPVPPIPSG